MLDALVARSAADPVGVVTLAVAVGEEQRTVEEVAEPYLVRAGCWPARPAAGWPLRRPGGTWVSRCPRAGSLAGCSPGPGEPLFEGRVASERCDRRAATPGLTPLRRHSRERRIDSSRWRATRQAAAVRVPPRPPARAVTDVPDRPRPGPAPAGSSTRGGEIRPSWSILPCCSSRSGGLPAGAAHAPAQPGCRRSNSSRRDSCRGTR